MRRIAAQARARRARRLSVNAVAVDEKRRRLAAVDSASLSTDELNYLDEFEAAPAADVAGADAELNAQG